MPLQVFHPVIQRWFRERFSAPTEPQRLGWPHIAAARHTLIAAPTGSGKTLSAFLVSLDRLFRAWVDGRLEDRIYTVYVSPLKALSNDIQRNLQMPLAEIAALSAADGLGTLPIRTMVRTGDTPPAERQAMLRRPPHILVTTPESLYLLLTSRKSRELLRSVETVIVDEIHALARDKRGSHLALTLARLEALGERPPARIGLSATQRPIDEIARLLVGTDRVDAEGRPDCTVIDVGHMRELDLALEVPPSQLSAVCSNEQWAEIYQRLTELIAQHRSTLVFVNTRRLAERAAHELRELLGEEAVASHHGSLSREIRQSAEQRLKTGQLRAIVATASLEMGIDIGYIDLACQIGSPRSIATFLQRVGRAGHSLHKTPKGRLFPLTRDELLECLALVRAVREGRLDQIEIPEAPLDILAQQIVAAVACEEWDEAQLYELCRRAWPYRHLSRGDFDSVVGMLSDGLAPGMRRGTHLHHDRIAGRLRPRRGARLAAITSGGAIPDSAQYRVITEPEGTFVGTVDEDFAIESLAGDVFLLGNTSWRIRYVRGGEVVVRDAAVAPPSIPFWLGEAPGRTMELSAELARLRAELARQLGQRAIERTKLADRSDQSGNGLPLSAGAGENDENVSQSPRDGSTVESVGQWLEQHCGATAWAAAQAVAYVEAQLAAVGVVPTLDEIVFERFFDESGGMQLVIHSPLGARINRAWGLALRKRFCRSFDFELQASADDDGIVLSLGPQHSFPLDSMFRMLNTQNVATLLQQALLAVPMFQVRWRWNVTRALCVLRQQAGRRVPPYLQRMRSDDALAAVFPETVGCLENHSGDVAIPDHPLVRQTMHDCLHEAMDLDGLVALLGRFQSGGVRFVGRDTREPSPFSYELLNANPYAFLDPAPLEERRTRAVATRRVLSADDVRELARLDPAAIERVRRESWPLVRDPDELHDALMELVVITESEAAAWSDPLDVLIERGRAARIILADGLTLTFAAERWPVIKAAYGVTVSEPQLELGEQFAGEVDGTQSLLEIVSGRIQHSGPVTAEGLACPLGLNASRVAATLEALEGKGTVLRGTFMPRPRETEIASTETGATPVEWCERRLLARIHRLTLDGLRRQIEPVDTAAFLRFLARYHRLTGVESWGGAAAVREVVSRLQGFELPAGAWEHPVLAARVTEYDPAWLDHLFLSGEVVWGRLSPPRVEQGEMSMAALTRTVPISLSLREALDWLLPGERPAASIRSGAQQVLEALTARGALFFSELKQSTGLLSAQLEEALRELAALGLVTSDAFAAVRGIVGRERAGSRAARRGRRMAAVPLGRWSLFPGAVVAAPRAQRVERWCRQLLARYGVVFRELLARETSAPSWRELVPVLRRLEMRGEVRGGRFVHGVAGEQFGTEEAIELLRKVREPEADEPWIVLSAADPLNLVGIVTPGPRITATHRNGLIFQGGRVIACQQARRVEFYESVDPATQWEMRQALRQGRRRRAEPAQP